MIFKNEKKQKRNNIDKIQGFDDTVAPNKSEALVIAALVDCGFETTSEYIDLGDANSRYTAIKFYKPFD